MHRLNIPLFQLVIHRWQDFLSGHHIRVQGGQVLRFHHPGQDIHSHRDEKNDGHWKGHPRNACKLNETPDTREPCELEDCERMYYTQGDRLEVRVVHIVQCLIFRLQSQQRQALEELRAWQGVQGHVGEEAPHHSSGQLADHRGQAQAHSHQQGLHQVGDSLLGHTWLREGDRSLRRQRITAILSLGGVGRVLQLLLLLPRLLCLCPHACQGPGVHGGLGQHPVHRRYPQQPTGQGHGRQQEHVIGIGRRLLKFKVLTLGHLC
mmetsp:Transcript_22432/g.38335  ORF Transcript_22432/g.38335 Transcript_22432/m.38335 type:complete len:263 (+) Transcript_22432:143-931(+)